MQRFEFQGVEPYGAVRIPVINRLARLADALRDRLACLEQSLVIVIDDLQWLDDLEGEGALLSLMVQSSPNVRWILSTRRLPRFDLQRLKFDVR